MNEEDRDSLLSELKTDMKWVIQELSNHLKTHSSANRAAWTTAAGAIIALAGSILALIILLFKLT